MSTSRKDLPPMLSRATVWTLERIGALSGPEVKQLRANAERLQEPEIAALCTQVLKARPRVAATAAGKAAPKKAKLVKLTPA